MANSFPKLKADNKPAITYTILKVETSKDRENLERSSR
jgi:hypothetical protein